MFVNEIQNLRSVHGVDKKYMVSAFAIIPFPYRICQEKRFWLPIPVNVIGGE
jgi:hypothetical protein